MKRTSEQLFAVAQRFIPGGVNSPVRAFLAVGGVPRFIARGAGPVLTDVEGREYIDYIGSWGPLILGHAHPEVLAAVQEAAAAGTSYGAPTERELALAELIVGALPGMEMVRMMSSGTEATMTAVRLARAYTGRSLLIKFDGCYHGHADSLLVAAGSGLATLGIPASPGVPPELAALTLSLPYNDTEAVHRALASNANRIAAIIVEPAAANMGVIPPRPGFLQALREISRKAGIVLIFDEVISGFRLAWGGMQTITGVVPDLTCLGKIIGGGLPVGACGGRAAIMSQLAPVGPVYQAGTLSGNPLAMAAGLATLQVLQREPSIYTRLEGCTATLCGGLQSLFTAAGTAVRINRLGSMFTVFFTDRDVYDWESAGQSSRERFGRFFRAMLAGGIMLPPSPFESCFVSAAHTDAEIAATLAAARAAVTVSADAWGKPAPAFLT